MNTYEKPNIYTYLSYKDYLRDLASELPRGLKSSLAKAMGCQSAYFIRVLNHGAQLTEDQAFRASRYLKLKPNELEYFLDLVRLEKAGDLELKNYFMEKLKVRSAASRKIQDRVAGKPLNNIIEEQLSYYSGWIPPTLHVATSCNHLQTVKALAARFSLSEDFVRLNLQNLSKIGMVTEKNGKYSYQGKSLHLSKESPIHKSFQRIRRDQVVRALERQNDSSLHFASTFATSKKHWQALREKCLAMIENTDQELQSTPPEDVVMLVIDLFRVE